jgi:hypothetical protein
MIDENKSLPPSVRFLLISAILVMWCMGLLTLWPLLIFFIVVFAIARVSRWINIIYRFFK